MDKAAGGAFWAPPAEWFVSGRQDLPMVSRLGLFASVRRAISSEIPTAGEVTVTDGEHGKDSGERQLIALARHYSTLPTVCCGEHLLVLLFENKKRRNYARQRQAGIPTYS